MESKVIVPEDSLKHPLTREVILHLKTRALRRRVWFRVLDRVERGLLDLTTRWVDRVRSSVLARVLLRILAKLVRALEAGMVRVLEKGRVLARGLSELAVGWGYGEAWEWRFEPGFHRALGFGVLFCG